MSKWEIIYDWNVQICFPIEEDNDGYPEGRSCEELFAWPIKENESYFCVESIPFFVKGLSRGDIVQARIVEKNQVHDTEFFEFERLVERGGHNTYRLLVRNSSPKEPELTEKELREMGLMFEVDKKDFFAVDVPPDVDQDEIDDFLIAEAESGRWGLQDGYVKEREPGS